MTKTPIKNDIVEHHSYQREPMRFIDATTLEINREPSDLDRLALEFTTILEKHTPYVIVSGYVSILLGRARASEDIDIIIPKIPFPTLKKLVHDLKEKNFSCINEEKDNDIFDCLAEGLDRARDLVVVVVATALRGHRALALQRRRGHRLQVGLDACGPRASVAELRRVGHARGVRVRALRPVDLFAVVQRARAPGGRRA